MLMCTSVTAQASRVVLVVVSDVWCVFVLFFYLRVEKAWNSLARFISE